MGSASSSSPAPQQILLNFFIAIILDNLDLDEETKVQRLKVEWVEWRWGGSVQWAGERDVLQTITSCDYHMTHSLQ